MTTFTSIKKNYEQGLKDFANITIEKKNTTRFIRQDTDNTILLSNGHVIVEIDKYIFNNIVSTLPDKYQRFYSNFEVFDIKKFMYDVAGDFCKGKVTSLIMNQSNMFNIKTIHKRVCSMLNNEDGKQYTSYCYIDDVYFDIVKHFSATNNMIFSKNSKCVIFDDKATNCRALIMCIYTPSHQIKEDIEKEMGIEL